MTTIPKPPAGANQYDVIWALMLILRLLRLFAAITRTPRIIPVKQWGSLLFQHGLGCGQHNVCIEPDLVIGIDVRKADLAVLAHNKD